MLKKMHRGRGGESDPEGHGPVDLPEGRRVVEDRVRVGEEVLQKGGQLGDKRVGGATARLNDELDDDRSRRQRVDHDERRVDAQGGGEVGDERRRY